MMKKKVYGKYIMSTIILLCILILGGVHWVRADESIQYSKSFISIQIQSGDTLSSIAKEYAVSEDKYSDYIEEVKSINNLKSDTIHAGCYLMIPIYQIIP